MRVCVCSQSGIDTDGGVCYRPLLLDSLIVIVKADHSNSKSNKHFQGSNFSED